MISVPATATQPDRSSQSGSLQRLYRAVERARNGMEDFRRKRKAAVDRIVDDAYGKAEAGEHSGVNQMRFALYVYTRQLAPRNPQGLLITRSDVLKRSAKELQLATNETCTAMNLARTVETAIMQAMTSIGVVKTGVTHASNYELPSYSGDGYPYACPVDFDDFVFDFYARKWEDVEFLGNFYRIPKEDLEEDESYDQSVVKKLQTSEKRPYNETGEERTEQASREADTGTDEYYDYVDLCDLYIPRTREFLTVSADFEKTLPPLRRTKWTGAPGGPYHLLYYYDVDGQLMPIPPAAFWQDIHDLTKELMLKLGDQGLRQKNVALANAQRLDESKAIINAKDGEVIPTVGTPALAEFRTGGVDNNTLAFVTFLMGIFNKQNWNIEVLAGLGPQSNTLGQDEMISASANKQLQDMQERTFKFTAGIIRSLAWTILTDPLVDIPITYTVDGMPEIKVEGRYTPKNQRGEIVDFNVEVHPYSMKLTTPAARLNAINGFLQSVVMPLGQFMQQQGITIDWKLFIELWSQYAQLPEIKDLVKFTPAGQIEPADAAIRKPPQSTRNYVRRNVKDSSPDAERMQMMQTLMSRGEAA